jgi:hypothetical protein
MVFNSTAKFQPHPLFSMELSDGIYNPTHHPSIYVLGIQSVDILL